MNCADGKHRGTAYRQRWASARRARGPEVTGRAFPTPVEPRDARQGSVASPAPRTPSWRVELGRVGARDDLLARARRAPCDPAASRRHRAPVHRRQAELVGVFVNPTLDEVAAAVDAASAQRGPAARRRGPVLLRRGRRRTGAQVIKAVPRRRPRPTCRRSTRFHTSTSTCSTPHVEGAPGGTGADLGLGARAAAGSSKVPLILSGGLTADNVADGDRGRRARSRSTSPAAPRPRPASRTRRSCARSSSAAAAGAGVVVVTAASSTASAPTAASTSPRR